MPADFEGNFLGGFKFGDYFDFFNYRQSIRRSSALSLRKGSLVVN
jgi:hypothetical protein